MLTGWIGRCVQSQRTATVTKSIKQKRIKEDQVGICGDDRKGVETNATGMFTSAYKISVETKY